MQTSTDSADFVAATGSLSNLGNGGERVHARARQLGQPQIILGQSVLGAMSAPRHTFTAFDATGAIWANTSEEWIRFRDTVARPEINSDRREPESVTHPHVIGDGLHDQVTWSHRRILSDPEHSSRLVIERCQLIGPVGDIDPLRIGEVLLAGHVQCVRIVQTATTNTCAGKYHDILQHMYTLEPRQAQLRCPQEPRKVPRVLWVSGFIESAPSLEHAYPIALLD